MDILIRMLMAVLKDRKHKKQRRVLSTVLAAVVVFMTTYSLILPAITLEESTAETTDGIFLESADVSEADPADDDVDPSGELLLTDDAREESAPASDGWEDGLIEDADWEENGELADIPDEPALTDTGDETEEAAETETGNVYAETEEATEDTTESEESVGEGETESELEEQYPEVELSDSTQYTQVKVYAPEGAFPEGTQMLLSDVEDDETIAAICDAALAENSLVQKVHAVDISFRNSRNEEIEPLLPIRVEMTAEKCAEVGSSSVSSSVVHVDDSGNATIVENAQKVEAEAEDEKDADKLEDVETIAFEAKEFSVYALVYTVDFHWEVDGQMYEFSLPGGGFISFSDLIEVLGVAKTGENDDVYLPGEVPGIDNQDANGENNTQESAESADNTGYSGVHNPMEVPGINDQDATGENGSAALTLDGVVVSEKTREFVADVKSVVFSSPELVDVSKVESETTVGGIKESRGLDVQYSAELTEEQIAEINAQTVVAGDWALISVQPFESTESLTVTMKTGEVFEIRVTDAQLKKTVKTASGETWEITITYDDSAEIPKDAELRVEEILPEDERYEQYYQQSLEKISVGEVPDTIEDESGSEMIDETAETASEEAATTTSYAHIFDIQIWAGDQQIEPASGSTVSVSIKLLDAPENEDTNLQVVHFGKDGLEVMELAENNDETKAGGTELNFVTDEFSVYAIIGTETFTEKFLTEDGETYNISVTAGAEAHIPADAHLEISEVKEGSDKYDELFAKAQAAVTDGKDASVPFARFFDIAIVKDGEKIQPDAPVDVKISFDETVEANKNAVFNAVHIADDGENVDVLDVETEGEESDEAVTVNAVQFEAEGFSIYGVTYTVDFETVDGVKWSWPGEGSYSIASILAEIGVADPATDVKLVRTVDEGGAENVLFLEEKEDGWYLTSEAAFRDTFVLSVAAGEKVYIITVTDASEVVSSDGIKSLLTGVNITGAKNENGTYVFYPDQPYGIELSFKEVNKNNGQFPMSDSFTYQLPSGLVPYGNSVSNYLEVELSGGEHAGEKVKLNYTISQDGLITFTWDKTTNPAAYDQLKDSLYAQFRLKLECTYTGTGGKLDFGNGIEKDVTVRSNGKVTVKKTGKYDAATKKINYEVVVTSDGVTKEVVVTDTVSGSALTYNRDATAETTVAGKTVSAPESSRTGFTMNIGNMSDQETITIKYSADVNLDNLHKNPDGSWGTFEETGNSVVAKSKDNPDVVIEHSGKDFEHKISISNIGKNGTVAEADENGNATTIWTINVNDNANVSMAGHTISDSIDGNSVPIAYGDNIHVVARKADGSIAYDNDIRWGDNGLIKAADGKSWTWTVPNQQPHTQKLSYIITYTTVANVAGKLIATDIKNTAESDNGGKADTGTKVNPHGGALNAHKKVIKTDLASKTITWEVNFDVPATGLDSVQINDTLPSYYNYSGQLIGVDDYLGDSTINITPALEGDESYAVTTSTDDSGKKHVIINFYKMDGERVVPGLSGTGSKRRIRVQFQTEIDEDWLQAAIDNPSGGNALNHTNSADVILNGQTIDTSATTKIDGNEPSMSKVHGDRTVFSVGGDTLPSFPYTIKLSGVSDDSFDDQGQLVIEDTFNGKYLAYYDNDAGNTDDHNSNNGYIYGSEPGTNINDRTSKGDRVVSSAGDGKIRIVINRDTLPMQGADGEGGFYPYYLIQYYLTVKDPLALNKLESALEDSESGTYSFVNTVSNQKFGTTSDTVEYSIPVIKKEITSPGGKAYYENGNWLVDFTLDVNPDGLALGDEQELTLTDDYTNLAVDYTTIKIQKEVNGALSDATVADGVTWNRKGNRVTYILKNGVHYIITYKARVTGQPQGNDDKVYYSNTAEYFGVKSWASGDQNIKDTGEGSAPTYGITVFKHKKGSGAEPLSGAKFNLYKYVSTEGQEDGWQSQPSNAIDITTRKPVDTGWGDPVKELITDSQGVAKTLSSDRIQPHTWYMLIETQAPVYEGSQRYQLKNFGYVFWITDTGVANYGSYVYLNDDVVAVDNEPPIPETVNIGVAKTWEGDEDDKTKRKDITVRLYADGVPYDSWKDSAGNPLAPRTDTVMTLPVKANGEIDEYVWTGLPGGPVYSVVEDSVPGYTTTYSPRETQVSGTITIKNKHIPDKTFIHVEKNWSADIEESNIAEDITVQLKRKVSPKVPVVIRGNINGALGGTIWNTTIAAGSGFTLQYQWNQDWGTHVVEYYVYNRGTGRLITSGTHTIQGIGSATISVPGADVPLEGVDIRFGTAYYADAAGFYSNYTIFAFNEVGGSGSGGSYVEDVNFNNENHYYTIDASTGWKIDIDRLVTQDDDGSYIYYIEEVGVNDNTETPDQANYKVTYGNTDGIAGGTGNESQDTIKVTNSPKPGSLEVIKKVVGPDAKGSYNIAVRGTNNHYYNIDGTDKGTDPFYVQFEKDGSQIWNNLLPGKYIVEEQDANVSGYTWIVSGTDGEVEVPSGETVEAEVTNVYEEKPASGSIKLTKSVTVNGEPTSTDAADGDYTFTITGPDGATATVATVTIKVSGGVATQYKLNNAATFTDLPADKYVVIPDLDLGDYVITESPVDGMAVSSITGGKTGTADKANRKVTVTVTADEVVPAEATVAFVNDVKQFKFKKVWLDSNDANANSVDWVKTITVELYGRKASASDTKIADYDVTYPAPAGAAYTAELKTETIGGKTYKSYEITFSKLSADYNSFYVKEKGLDAYFTTYGTTAESATTGQMSAEEGEYIINSLIKVELPDTGGPGTLLYSMLGMMLIAFAGTAYMILLRRRRASLKGGDNLR